jgi:hypothetical protein
MFYGAVAFLDVNLKKKKKHNNIYYWHRFSLDIELQGVVVCREGASNIFGNHALYLDSFYNYSSRKTMNYSFFVIKILK